MHRSESMIPIEYSPIYRCCSNVFSLNPPWTDFPMATLWDSRSPPLIQPPFPGLVGTERLAQLVCSSRHVCWWCVICMICMMYVHARIVWSSIVSIVSIVCLFCLIFHPQPGFSAVSSPNSSQPKAALWGHHRLQRWLGSFHGLHGWDAPRSANKGPGGMGEWMGYMDWRKCETLVHLCAPVDRWSSRFLRYNACIFRCSGMRNDQS